MSDTHFHAETPQVVRNTLENARQSRQRVRVWYGDTKTGKAWDEEFDVIGYVGRSTGRIKIPLCIHNSRSRGGCGFLDHCIVAIATAPKCFVYKHPGFDPGIWETGPAKSEGYLEGSYRDGRLVGQFKKPGAAKRHCQFMVGLRFAK